MTDEIKKWIGVAKDLTSTTAVIILVLYLVYQVTGNRNDAIYAAKASAEEAVAVSRQIADSLSKHIGMTSEEMSSMKMILVQICVNTAYGDKEAIRQCLNYR